MTFVTTDLFVNIVKLNSFYFIHILDPNTLESIDILPNLVDLPDHIRDCFSTSLDS